jgi:hypothetical protein
MEKGGEEKEMGMEMEMEMERKVKENLELLEG